MSCPSSTSELSSSDVSSISMTFLFTVCRDRTGLRLARLGRSGSLRLSLVLSPSESVSYSITSSSTMKSTKEPRLSSASSSPFEPSSEAASAMKR